jgi:hypothetical protein
MRIKGEGKTGEKEGRGKRKGVGEVRRGEDKGGEGRQEEKKEDRGT